MANIMTKRGSQDNVITYEHYCDAKADLANIPKSQTTLGSTAVVLKNENDELGIYIAGSDKQWVPVAMSSSGGSDDSSLASIIDRSVKDIVVPDGVTIIGFGVFYGCEHAESVSIPDSVIRIEGCAFSGLGARTGKTLDFVANSVEEVFSTSTSTPFGGAKIKRLILPSIKTIQGYAFAGCAKLEYIYLGPNCTDIEDYAFGGVPITCKVECGFADGAISGFPANGGWAGNPANLDITYNVSAPTI